MKFREIELSHLVTEGLTNAEIAEKIFLSPETIKGYRKNLLLKLDAKTRRSWLRLPWSKN